MGFCLKTWSLPSCVPGRDSFSSGPRQLPSGTWGSRGAVVDDEDDDGDGGAGDDGGDYEERGIFE